MALYTAGLHMRLSSLNDMRSGHLIRDLWVSLKRVVYVMAPKD